MKNPARPAVNYHGFGMLLFDTKTDPQQTAPIQEPAIEARLIQLMVKLMRKSNALREQFERLGLEGYLP